MNTKDLAIILSCFVMLQIFLPLDAKPLPGKKRAFGGGMLTGALAGIVMHRALSHHHQKQKITPNPNHITTIEKGPVMPNGCYKEILKETDLQDSHKFTETVHLICPQGVQPVVNSPVNSNAATALMPINNVANANPAAMHPQQQSAIVPTANNQMHQVPAQTLVQPQQVQQQQQQQQQLPQPTYVPAKNHMPMQTFMQPPQTQQQQSQQPQQQQQPPFVPATNHMPMQTFTQPQQVQQQQSQRPQQQPAIISAANNTVTPQVYILSKKTHFYGKSAAGIMHINLLLLSIVTFFVIFL